MAWLVSRDIYDERALSEGPFIVYQNGRLYEVRVFKNHLFLYPHLSICRMMEKKGFKLQPHLGWIEIAEVTDYLNDLVAEGSITFEDEWIIMRYVR